MYRSERATIVGLNPTGDVITSHLGEPVLSTWMFSLVTQPLPILITWPNIYPAHLWTLGGQQRRPINTYKPQGCYGISSACLLKLCSLRCDITNDLHDIGSLFRKQDGGTNKTAVSCGLPPGWTWRGGDQLCVGCKPQVQNKALNASS